MKFQTDRLTRKSATVGWKKAGKACPVCGRYWVSIKLTHKVYEVKQFSTLKTPAIWHTLDHAILCSSKCVDFWILQRM